MKSWLVQIACIGASLLLLVLIFPPLDVWPLAYVCFVPWLVMVSMSESARRVYLLSYILGLAFFTISISWLFMVTVAGSLFLFALFAVHFPLVACPVRHMVRRRGWPLAIAFPILWVGCEALRSKVLLPFPWNLLGHSHHAVLPMIQIADLVGAYGVSFVLASFNGLLADGIVAVLRGRWGLPVPRKAPVWLGPAFAISILVMTLGYGVFQMTRDTSSPGPRVAVVQGNYPNYVDMERMQRQPSLVERRERYEDLVYAAIAEQPDLILLPETPWAMYLNSEYLDNASSSERSSNWYTWSKRCRAFFENAADVSGAYIVTGSQSVEPTPYSLRAPDLRFNSAFVFPPTGEAPLRYDKIHCVLIGEYVPFRYGSLRWLYLWLNDRLPFGSSQFEYSLTPGTEFTTFTMRARSLGGKTFHFAAPICYENVMPYLSRKFVNAPEGSKQCDFLLNLSNDGWFANTAELPQHLAASVFRAVENRVGIARAVNTGISCFIDPNGHVHDKVTDAMGRAVGHGIDGYRVSTLLVDSRHTLYSRTGDWWAVACAVLWVLMYVDYIVARARAARHDRRLTE